MYVLMIWVPYRSLNMLGCEPKALHVPDTRSAPELHPCSPLHNTVKKSFLPGGHPFLPIWFSKLL